MTRRNVVLLSVILIGLCLVVSACSGQTVVKKRAVQKDSGAAAVVSAESAEEERPLPLEVKESGYAVQGEDNWVKYGVVIYNPNKTAAATFPTIKIDMRDADGNVLGAQDQVLNIIRPGQTVAWGGQADANGKRPDRIVFSAVVGEDNWTSADTLQPAGFREFGIERPKVAKGEYSTVVTGELINPNDLTYSMVAISVLLRDKDGKIVYGDGGFVQNVPANGKTPFEVELHSSTPAYSTVAVYAQSWDF